MSFAATIALVAVYEALRVPWNRLAARRGRAVARPLLYLGTVGLTTLVAGIATSPFAVFHFNRVADYGLLANLCAVPITGLWVMPWGLLALLLLPFGAESAALTPMGWGLDVVLWVAHRVAALPGAVSHWPAMPTATLALIAVGGLWLCLWRRRWRLLGIAPIASGCLVMALARPPDLIVDGDARLLGVRDLSGEFWLSSTARARFAGKTWLRRAGQAEASIWSFQDGTARPSGMRCDSLGCIHRIEGQVLAVVRDPRALAEDCGASDVVVSLVPVRGACPSAHTVIDRFDLWRGGTHAIWLQDGSAKVESVAKGRGDRPWTASHHR